MRQARLHGCARTFFDRSMPRGLCFALKNILRKKTHFELYCNVQKHLSVLRPMMDHLTTEHEQRVYSDSIQSWSS